MPSYKTHSIHGEYLCDLVNSRVPLDRESLKLFCMGPDAMIITDYQTFHYQHAHKTRDYFLNFIKMIKERNLQYNTEVVSFLYGQIDHFVLDATFHPFIYYITEKFPKSFVVCPHSMVEMWMDEYTMEQFDRKDTDYYNCKGIHTVELKSVIDDVYKNVFGVKNESIKYNIGMMITRLFDSCIRTDSTHLFSWLMKAFRIGDISYHCELKNVIPFLNLDKQVWYDPETKEKRLDSFHDLWKESLEKSSQIIENINEYLYEDKEFYNKFLMKDLSYNTGHKCSKGQTLQYVKKY